MVRVLWDLRARQVLPPSPKSAFPPMVNNKKVIVLEPEELGKNVIAKCLSALSTPVGSRDRLRRERRSISASRVY